jgi:hypothetical protein
MRVFVGGCEWVSVCACVYGCVFFLAVGEVVWVWVCACLCVCSSALGQGI